MLFQQYKKSDRDCHVNLSTFFQKQTTLFSQRNSFTSFEKKFEISGNERFEIKIISLPNVTDIFI